MNNHDKIELPPLPESLIVSYQTDSTMRSMELRTHSDEAMQDYARTAIEADRKTYNSIGEGTIQQLHDVLLYLQNETMKLEAAYGSNFKKEATEKARAATEKMKEAVYAIKNIDRQRRGEPVAYQARLGVGMAWHECDEAAFDIVNRNRPGDARKLYTSPQPAEPVCTCKTHALGVVHRTDGPCFHYEPQPAEPVVVDHGENRVNIGLEAGTGSDLGGVVDHGEAEPVKVQSDGIQRDPSGKTWMGMRVAAYQWEVQHDLGYMTKHATHWSTGPKDAERLYREGDIRALLARYGAQPAASAEQEPAAYCQPDDPINSSAFSWPGLGRKKAHTQPLYLAPVAAQPSVPEPCTDDRHHERYIAGWNACRAAMLETEQAQQDDPTPEEEEAWQRMERRS